MFGRLQVSLFSRLRASTCSIWNESMETTLKCFNFSEFTSASCFNTLWLWSWSWFGCRNSTCSLITFEALNFLLKNKSSSPTLFFLYRCESTEPEAEACCFNVMWWFMYHDFISRLMSWRVEQQMWTCPNTPHVVWTLDIYQKSNQRTIKRRRKWNKHWLNSALGAVQCNN